MKYMKFVVIREKEKKILNKQMSCNTFSDCDSMSCDKIGSDMICSEGACACTLPRKEKNKNYMVILIITVTVIFFLLFTQSSSHLKCMNIRAMKATSESAREKSPQFIQTDTFKGAKAGYVFKTDAGITGYYRDTYNQ